MMGLAAGRLGEDNGRNRANGDYGADGGPGWLDCAFPPSTR